MWHLVTGSDLPQSLALKMGRTPNSMVFHWLVLLLFLKWQTNPDFDLGRFTVRNKWWKDLWELSCFDPTHGFSNFCLEGGQLWVGLETHQTIDISWDICCNHSRPGYNYTFIHLERLTLWLALARCHNNALPNGIGPLHGRIFIYIYTYYIHIIYILILILYNIS
jgi:hypothetical protein